MANHVSGPTADWYYGWDQEPDEYEEHDYYLTDEKLNRPVPDPKDTTQEV